MGDVLFGYVYDFGSGEEWTAERGGGARSTARRSRRRGRRRSRSSPSRRRRRVRRRKAAAMLGVAGRLRVMGSLALSLCHLAAGPRRRRLLAEAGALDRHRGGQLLVRERGFAIELFEAPPFAAAPLDLEGRSRVVAAATPASVPGSRQRSGSLGGLDGDHGGGGWGGGWGEGAEVREEGGGGGGAGPLVRSRHGSDRDAILRSSGSSTRAAQPVTELDMVRDVVVHARCVEVTIALTVAGCPIALVRGSGAALVGGSTASPRSSSASTS